MSDVNPPEAEHYEDVVGSEIVLDVRGKSCPALLFRPLRPGLHPAVAIGQEATGRHRFICQTAAALAHMGCVTVVPDYYHGQGPRDPEAYEDLDTLIAYMAALDFRQGAYDLMAALDHVKGLPAVDPRRLGVWGYCTGATIALLAACLRSDLTAAVLFYPSQPRFDVLDVKKPMHPIDLMWNLTAGVLLLVGDDDLVWPPELIAEVGSRLTNWGVDHAIKTYSGAGHAFCAPTPAYHHPAAARAAWTDSCRYLSERLL